MSQPLDYSSPRPRRSVLPLVSCTCSSIALISLVSILFVFDIGQDGDVIGFISIALALISLPTAIISLVKARPRSNLAIVSVFVNLIYWPLLAWTLTPKLRR